MPVGNKAVRRPLDGLALTLMPFLCLCWGLHQVAIKEAAHDMSPVLQIGLRSIVSASLLAAVMFCRRESFSLNDGTFWPGVITGVLFSGQFLCVGLGLQHTTASHMTVFMYAAPVFTALGLHWFVPGEQLHTRQFFGIGLAFIGIAVAFSNGFHGNVANTLPGDTLAVISGALWAATTIMIRRSCLSETPSTKTLLYELVCAAIILPICAGFIPHARPVFTNTVWASLAFQAIIVSFASYLTWTWMLRRYLAARLSVFSFLTPLFGVGFGVLLLHDPIDSRFGAGAVLVLAGIILVNWHATALSLEGE